MRNRIVLLAATSLAMIGCKFNRASEVKAETGQKTWSSIRSEREREIKAYSDSKKTDFVHFRDFTNGKTGVPYIIFRVFPEVFPDLWDKETNAPIGLSGFHKNNFAPWRPIAQGLGWNTDHIFPSDAIPVQVANLTCGACHMGQVKGNDGKVYDLVGGANTQINVLEYLRRLSATASDPRFSFENFKAKIENHKNNPDFWYGTDKLAATDKALADKLRAMALRDIETILKIGAELLPVLKSKMISSGVGVEFMAKHKYGPEMNTSGLENFTGSFDAYGVALTRTRIGLMQNGTPEAPKDPTKPTLAPSTDPTTLIIVLPGGTKIEQKYEPARVDIPAVWNQLERPSAQWDNSIVPPILRNLAAEFATVGDERMLDIRLAHQSGTFLEGLKASPYPLEELDMAQVERGRILADKNCSSCHKAVEPLEGKSEEEVKKLLKRGLIPFAAVGTDPNRARMFTPFFGMKVLDPVLRSGCNPAREPELCQFSNNQLVVNPNSVANPSYAALPLKGSWATAPYNHNGSIPTMYHLLVPEDRPKTFCRGSINYDTKNMGYDWQLPCPPGSTVYDTTMAGQSNAGHTGAFLGSRSWSGEENRKDREDLIAFLKSL